MIVMIDGIEFKKEHFIVAIGVDQGGNKHILGVRQGPSENRSVCLELLNDLERRRMDMKKRYLFVLDGSKSLRSAVAEKFGEDVEVQRCQIHKRRNVKSHLQEEHQEEFDRRIRNAYNMTGYAEAKESLLLTIRQLKNINPSAARSLEEGLEETLTLHRLCITGLLRKTLTNTNVIESCFARVRYVSRRVKRWRKGRMMERWVCASLLYAERKFRQIRGYRELRHLENILKNKLKKKEVAA